HNSSGDIFLAFATGNELPFGATAPDQPLPVQMLPNQQMDALFHATAEATAEAIWNTLCGAETMVGFQGRTVYALPQDELVALWQRYQTR
ncbi:MAG: P1 family peptidase, partial [Caldilineaceae bacterium]|nr:P1 family peptidase [Caldilineaceae bacterium]